MLKHRKRSWLLLVAATLVLSACGGGGGGDPADDPGDDPGTGLGAINGRVVNAITGGDVAGATITVGDKTATSSATGEFTVSTDYGDRIGVSVSAEGYADNQKIVVLSEAQATATLTVKLLEVSHTETFSGSTGKMIAVPASSAAVDIAGNSLVTADGSVAAGDVTASLTIVNPSLDPEVMPGDFMGDDGSGMRNMESYGALAATFVDASDAPLNLTSGTTSTIRIPAQTISGVAPPPTIPLFYYDATQLKWVQQGTATLVNDVEPYYTGTVEHFSTWNADVLYDSVDITGCVQDLSGSPVAGAKVTSTGDDYIGTATAYTRTDGTFTVRARPNSVVVVSASKENSTSNSVSINTGDSAFAIPSCLLMGTAQVSIKLTWGEAPADLDSYLFTPGGDEISYSMSGALDTSPYASLDVDDTESYGPEVITISQLSPGQYQYFVNNFSEEYSPGQTGSPARVELLANGRSHIYSPPAGEDTNDWWHVFDLTVDNSGNVSVTTVGTWSSTSPSAFKTSPSGKSAQGNTRFDRIN